MAVSLEDGGRATARLLWKTHTFRSVSRFASRDGEHHSDERDDDRDLRLSGAWTEAGVSLTLRFDRIVDSKGLSAGGGPLALACTAVSSSKKEAPLLVCRLDSKMGPLPDLLHASDESGHRRWAPITEEDQPWVVLGAGPGIAVRWSDERGRTELGVSTPAHPLTEANLEGALSGW